MADTDTQTPNIADQIADIQRQLAQPAPAIPTGSPNDDTSPSWTGLLGRALGGAPAGYQLRGGEADAAGNRALLNFGINMLLASGPHTVRPNVLSSLATGLQGAQESVGQDQRSSAALAGAQYQAAREARQDQLARIKEAIPLLQMKARLDATGQLKNPLTAGPGTAPPPGTSIATGGSIGGPLLDALANIESGDQNIVSNVDKDSQGKTLAQGGNADEISQGHFQIQTATWRDFAKQAGVDTDQFPTAMSAPRDVQARVASVIPLSRFGPRTQTMLRQQFGPLDGGQTIGALGAARPSAPGQAGPGAPPDAPGQTAMAPVGTQPPNTPGQIPPAALPAPVQTAGPGVPTPPGGPVMPPGFTQPPAGAIVRPAEGAPGQIAAPIAPPPPAPVGKSPDQVASPEEYYREHPLILTPEQQRSTSTELNPDVSASMARQEQIARNAVDLLVNQAKQTGDPALVPKIADATDKYNTIVSQNIKTRQDQIDKGHAAYNEIQKNWQAGLKDSFNTQRQQAQAHANQLEQATAVAHMDTGKKDVETAGTDANQARRILPILRQMAPQLENLPNGVVGGLLQKYPELVPVLQAGKVIDPAQATNVQLLQSARAYLSLLQKPVGSGSLRIPEMDNLASYTPGALNTPQARQEMLARLIAVNQRVVDEHNFTSNYFGRTDPQTGKTLYNTRGLEAAMNGPLKLDSNGHPTTDSGLGPVTPVPPPLPSGRPTADQIAAHTAYDKYIRNVLPDNSPYWTYRQRIDPTTKMVVSDKSGNPVMERVLRIKGVNDGN